MHLSLSFTASKHPVVFIHRARAHTHTHADAAPRPAEATNDELRSENEVLLTIFRFASD